MNKSKYWIFTALFFIGCSSVQLQFLDDRYGTEDTENRHGDSGIIQDVDYVSQVKPIIQNRCVVCHGCYDAPCQLKFEAPIGIERGASKDKIYSSRILATSFDTLFSSNNSVEDWREKGFHTVLNERRQSKEANRESSLMFKMLLLKQQNPGTGGHLLDDSFDLSLNRQQACPRIDEFADYAQDNPTWGMPFGLPALNAQENSVVMQWLEQGASLPTQSPPELSEQVQKWELFFNGDSLKEQLMARYIYEHLFLANIYFSESPRKFYRLVRSSSGPGDLIKKISSRRPYDDPGVSRVFYRLEAYPATILAKNHLPYRFDNARLLRFKNLFIDKDYSVNELPSYETEIASNPFKAFKIIPAKSRYKFMLDEARFTIMGFIKGPVCRGQVALDVINDHFWVVFENPDDITTEVYDDFLVEQNDHLRLPASDRSTVLSPLHWHKYARMQNQYLSAKLDLFRELEKDGKRSLDLSLIWDGEDTNPNAALTIFRHHDSASVEYGFVGEKPKTSWLITYPLLERIHYLLVAGFDVYGNAGHQLETRLYMDFLRMEGEANFLELLPIDDRKTIHDHWYRDAPERVREFIFGDRFSATNQTQIAYNTNDTKSELFDLLGEHISQATKHPFVYQGSNNNLELQLNRLSRFTGKNVSILPHQFYLKVLDAGEALAKPSNGIRQKPNTKNISVFSIIRNSAHSNIAHLFHEESQRLPAEDTLTVAKGFIGNYPNTFFEVDADKLSDFVDKVLAVQHEEDYYALKTDYGVRRTDKKFWQYGDDLHKQYMKNNPIEFGLLDFNRLENR